MSAEFQVAKVAFTNVVIWVLAWAPYVSIVMTAAFIDRMLVTPEISQVGAFVAKLASTVNPCVTALSHPQYRQELSYFLGCRDRPKKRRGDDNTICNDA